MSACDLNWRHVDHMLEDWGRWIEDHASMASYPNHSAIVGVISDWQEDNWFRVKQRTANGHASLIFGGHRILCVDMPERIRATNLLVNRLPYAEYDAILAEYGLGVRDDGLRFSRADKARALGVTVESFEKRLRRARGRLGEILANLSGCGYSFA